MVVCRRERRLSPSLSNQVSFGASLLRTRRLYDTEAYAMCTQSQFIYVKDRQYDTVQYRTDSVWPVCVVNGDEWQSKQFRGHMALNECFASNSHCSFFSKTACGCVLRHSSTDQNKQAGIPHKVRTIIGSNNTEFGARVNSAWFLLVDGGARESLQSPLLLTATVRIIQYPEDNHWFDGTLRGFCTIEQSAKRLKSKDMK